MHSLQARLVTLTAVLLAGTLSLAAVAIYLLMRASLLAEFDGALLVEARSLASHVEQSGEQMSLESDIDRLFDYARPDHPHYFEIWQPDGNVQAKSVSLKDQDLQRPAHTAGDPQYQTTTLPNGLSGRQIVLSFHPRFEEEGSAAVSREPKLTISVARDTATIDSTLRTLAGLLLLVTLATVLGSIAALSRLIGRGLGPLNALASSIEQVATDDLGERVRLDNAPTEMTPVVQRLNGLLDRLGQTLARERAFTADVAHELRTPLAGLQTALEVCSSRLREPQAYQQTIEQCLRVTEDMHSMVINLLTLARADARQLTVEIGEVEIGELLQDCWAPFEPLAQVKRLEVQWNCDRSRVVRMDREKTKLVLRNLFENAVTYAENGGWIRATIVLRGTNLEMSLANNGCRLEGADATSVFDRFWRGDKARAEAGLHSGLGLPLCQKMMEVLGGSIAATAGGGEFVVTAIFPQSSQAEAGQPAET